MTLKDMSVHVCSVPLESRGGGSVRVIRTPIAAVATVGASVISTVTVPPMSTTSTTTSTTVTTSRVGWRCSGGRWVGGWVFLGHLLVFLVFIKAQALLNNVELACYLADL